jgi:hypothetical protein
MLVNADDGTVNQQRLDRFEPLLRGLFGQRLPNADFLPAAKPVVHSIPGTETRRQITPGTTDSCPKKHCFNEIAV